MTHVPVLLQETLHLLSPRAGDRVLDCTLGLGGHASSLLQAIGHSGHLVALEADRQNLREAIDRLGERDNLTLLHHNFRHVPDCLPQECSNFDVILADLGLSSPHVDDARRGFSFRSDAPLDLRFDRERGLMAAHYLQSIDQRTLLRIVQEYGEVPRPHAFVRAVVQRRSDGRIRTTTDLADVVRDVYGRHASSFLPQIFQAVRIAVNDEMGALDRLLSALPQIAKHGARVAIISYHSLEDRRVKDVFRAYATCPTDPVTGAPTAAAIAELLTRKPIVPTDDEKTTNPRSRSAKLRAIRFR